MEVRLELFRPCPGCDGAGTKRHLHFYDERVPCYHCGGKGTEITEDGKHFLEFLRRFPAEEDDGK
jgi:DnaJ-class molecular chaperone